MSDSIALCWDRRCDVAAPLVEPTRDVFEVQFAAATDTLCALVPGSGQFTWTIDRSEQRIALRGDIANDQRDGGTRLRLGGVAGDWEVVFRGETHPVHVPSPPTSN